MILVESCGVSVVGFYVCVSARIERVAWTNEAVQGGLVGWDFGPLLFPLFTLRLGRLSTVSLVGLLEGVDHVSIWEFVRALYFAWARSQRPFLFHGEVREIVLREVLVELVASPAEYGTFPVPTRVFIGFA